MMAFSDPADEEKEERQMKLSARNALPGRISAIKKGAVMAHVTVDLDGGTHIHSAIFVESVDDLGLQEGDQVVALIKSTDVMIAKA
jgi:molybdopterin-binding protein